MIEDGAVLVCDGLIVAADTRARDTGWTVTVVPGPLGLNGRSYRDPRFGTGRGR